MGEDSASAYGRKTGLVHMGQKRADAFGTKTRLVYLT